MDIVWFVVNEGLMVLNKEYLVLKNTKVYLYFFFTWKKYFRVISWVGIGEKIVKVFVLFYFSVGSNLEISYGFCLLNEEIEF